MHSIAGFAAPPPAPAPAPGAPPDDDEGGDDEDGEVPPNVSAQDYKEAEDKLDSARAAAAASCALSALNAAAVSQAEAKVAICTDRLRKKNRIECQELIDLNLNKDLELRYSQCIRSAETPPILKEFGKKDIRPLYTEPLGDKGYLKDWGIVFCDPTLPEAGGL